MAERTAVWKYDSHTGETYIEFDFLAVLDSSTETKFDYNCGACVGVITSPVDLLALTAHGENEIVCQDSFVNRVKFDALFWKEINLSLVSSCDCVALEINYFNPLEPRKVNDVSYLLMAEENPHSQQGCEKCVTEMPTGI